MGEDLSSPVQYRVRFTTFGYAATGVPRRAISSNLADLQQRWYGTHMTQLAKQLDEKFATWSPQVAAQVEQIVTDVIELADAQALDLLPSRTIVQEVLDALDEAKTR